MYGTIPDNNNDHDKKCCEAKVFEAKTLPECTNEVMELIGIDGPLVAKIPVVLAEPKIQIDIESVIELEEPALEIKRIKKNLFLNQCKLINTGDCKRGKLFISGFIRKNIEYATAYCKPENKRGGISGEIKHTTVDIPFECVTLVELSRTPIYNKSGFSAEKETFSEKMGSCNLCDNEFLGQNLCEQNFEHREYFTEEIFCELEDVKIFETDIKKNPVSLYGNYSTERVFKKITEKMVVYVKLKLLQKQQVKIPHFHHLSVKKHKHSKKFKCFKHMKKW